MIGAIIPAQNALFQSNYDPSERGRAYGVATAAQAVATIGAAVLAGRVYDLAPRSYGWVYAIAGLFGFASCWAFYRIRFRRRRGADGSGRPPTLGFGGELRRSLRSPFAGSITILRRDARFRRYEIAYMTYGIGFMMLQPVIPIFLVERLHVDYAQASNARGLIFYAMVFAFSPVFGRLLDRSDPVKTSALAFLVLALFPAALMLTRTVPIAYIAFAIYGVAMAAVNIGWTMGPIHFAGRSDSAAYMGAHVALVGVRGLVGGPLGIVIYRLAGTANATFACSLVLFVGATLLMLSLDRRAAG
jgi:predicted MFS family arabinose efflux permease